MRRFLCALLSVCLLGTGLSGCKSGEEEGTGQVPMGRYMEETLVTLDGLNSVYQFHRDAGGALVFFGLERTGTKKVYTRFSLPAVGGELVREELKTLGNFAVNGVRTVAEGPDGAVYVLYYSGVNYQLLAAKSVDGGRFEKLEVPELEALPGTLKREGDPVDEKPSKIPMDLIPLEDGGFLILYGGYGVSRYGADGALVAEYPGNADTSNTVAAGGTLITGSPDGGALWSYDLETGEQDAIYSYENTGLNLMVNADAENLYLADASGIYRQARGSTLWERLVEGGYTSLVMPNLKAAGLVPDGTGGFAALLTSEGTARLVRYAYMADVPTSPDTELTVFGLYDNSTVRQTIGRFQLANPSVRVTYRVGLDEGSSATAEDVIRALNTELVAGKGPDLLLLDGLPVDSYIEKGVLADITGLVEAEEGLMANLVDAYERDGKLYGVPSRFSVPVMMGKSSDMEAITSLQALVDRVKRDQGGMPPFLLPPAALWDAEGTGSMMRYYDVCASSWVGEGGAIDQAALIAYLTQVVELDRELKKYMPEDARPSGGTIAIGSSMGGNWETVDAGAMELGYGGALFHTQELEGPSAINVISLNLSKLGDRKLASLFGGGTYYPRGGIGLNAAGKQQALAESFLKLLLSPAIQDEYLYDGFPINSESLGKVISHVLSTRSNDDMGFQQICRELDTPIVVDRVIHDAVEAQLPGLADGSLTPEQAAAAVVEKTRLYLAE